MLEEPENNEEDAPEEAAEAPAEDAAEAPAEDAAEAPAEDAAPEEEAPGTADPGSDPGPSGAATPEEEELTPKQQRKRERSLHTETRPQRTPGERATERAGTRKRKAAERRRWRQRSREKRRAGGPREDTTPAAEERSTGRQRVRQGVVVSDRADKTITVRIETQRAHRTYGKVVRTSSTLHAHDEANDANAGDTVRVVESRPLSRTKRWRLAEILERAR